LHQTVRERISFFLSLDDDLRPFYAIGEEDPAFEPVIQMLYGYLYQKPCCGMRSRIPLPNTSSSFNADIWT
jgi:hypothetical protein